MSGVLCVMVSGATFSAVASPATVSNTGNSTTVISVIVSVSVSSGSGSYAFLIEKLSGDAITAQDPTQSSSRFQATLMAPEEERNAVFRWRVTDTASGAITYTPDTPVTLARDPL